MVIITLPIPAMKPRRNDHDTSCRFELLVLATLNKFRASYISDSCFCLFVKCFFLRRNERFSSGFMRQ